MSAADKTVASKERKLKIQKFQEKCTAIALQMAEKKAKEKESRKEEELGRQMEKKDCVVSRPPTTPSRTYTTQAGGGEW